jgi:hypothetical protein
MKRSSLETTMKKLTLAVLLTLTAACGRATTYDGKLSASRTKGEGSTLHSSSELTLSAVPGEREDELVIEGLASGTLTVRVDGHQLTVIGAEPAAGMGSASRFYALGSGVLTDTGLTLTLMSVEQGDAAVMYVESFDGKKRD